MARALRQLLAAAAAAAAAAALVLSCGVGVRAMCPAAGGGPWQSYALMAAAFNHNGDFSDAMLGEDACCAREATTTSRCSGGIVALLNNDVGTDGSSTDKYLEATSRNFDIKPGASVTAKPITISVAHAAAGRTSAAPWLSFAADNVPVYSGNQALHVTDMRIVTSGAANPTNVLLLQDVSRATVGGDVTLTRTDFVVGATADAAAAVVELSDTAERGKEMDVTLEDVRFTTTTSTGPLLRFNLDRTAPVRITLRRVHFANVAGAAGVLHVVSKYSQGAVTLLLEDCTFSNATLTGDAVRVDAPASSVTLRNVEFDGVDVGATPASPRYLLSVTSHDTATLLDGCRFNAATNRATAEVSVEHKDATLELRGTQRFAALRLGGALRNAAGADTTVACTQSSGASHGIVLVNNAATTPRIINEAGATLRIDSTDPVASCNSSPAPGDACCAAFAIATPAAGATLLNRGALALRQRAALALAAVKPIALPLGVELAPDATLSLRAGALGAHDALQLYAPLTMADNASVALDMGGATLDTGVDAALPLLTLDAAPAGDVAALLVERTAFEGASPPAGLYVAVAGVTLSVARNCTAPPCVGAEQCRAGNVCFDPNVAPSADTPSPSSPNGSGGTPGGGGGDVPGGGGTPNGGGGGPSGGTTTPGGGGGPSGPGGNSAIGGDFFALYGTFVYAGVGAVAGLVLCIILCVVVCCCCVGGAAAAASSNAGGKKGGGAAGGGGSVKMTTTTAAASGATLESKPSEYGQLPNTDSSAGTTAGGSGATAGVEYETLASDAIKNPNAPAPTEVNYTSLGPGDLPSSERQSGIVSVQWDEEQGGS